VQFPRDPAALVGDRGGHRQLAVAAEFASLADLLAVASDARWDTPSMCEAGGSAKSSRI
jgi:hypothetical protein